MLIRQEDWPNLIPVIHFAFDGMVGSGFFALFIAVLFWFVYFRRKRVIPEHRWLLRGIVLAGILSFVAVELGWIVTEEGRQPWVIYGFLRTRDAVTPAPIYQCHFPDLFLHLRRAIYNDGCFAAAPGTQTAAGDDVGESGKRPPDSIQGGRREPGDWCVKQEGKGGGGAMALPYIILSILWFSLIAYAVLGGADFGAGVWDMFTFGVHGRARTYVD